MSDDLLERLDRGVLHCGLHDDNETELFEVDDANDTMAEAKAEIEKLREIIQWFLDNDDTNEGDEPMPEHGGYSWDEINAYWIEGLNRARAALGKTK